MNLGIWRKIQYPLGVVFLSSILYFIIDFAFSWLRRLSLHIPSKGPENHEGAHSAEIYSNLSSPKVTVSELDIDFETILFDLKVENLDPYSELYRFSLSQSLLVNCLIMLSISLWLFFVLNPKANLSKNRKVLLSALLFNAFCSFAFLKLVAGSSSGHWDEVFVFASQATNLATGGLPAVPVSGPIGYADSSVDLGIVLVGGGMTDDVEIVMSNMGVDRNQLIKLCLESYDSCNRFTLDQIAHSIEACGLKISRIEMLTNTVQIPLNLSHIGLNNLLTTGAKLIILKP